MGFGAGVGFGARAAGVRFVYEGTAGPASGAGSSVTFSGINAGGEVVLVFVGWGDDDVPATRISGATYGGNAMALDAESDGVNRYFGAAAFSVAGPQSGNIVVNFGKSGIDAARVFVLSLYRTKSATPYDTDAQYGEAGGIAPNLDNLARAAGGGLRFGLLWDNAASGLVVPAGCTEIAQGAGTYNSIQTRYLLAWSDKTGTMTHGTTSSVITCAAGVSWR